MMNGTNPWDQILTDLKAKRAQLDSDIALAEQLRSRWGGATMGNEVQAVGAESAASSGTIAPNAFYGHSIADAAIKLLRMAGVRLTTNEIIEGVAKGGLPRSSYNTVYSILMRRAAQEQDIEKVDKQWGLPEWSGPRKRKPSVRPEALEPLPDSDSSQVQDDEVEKQ